MTRLQHRSGALPAGRDFLRTDAKTDVVGDRNHLILVGMAAVWFTLLVFTVQRLVVALQTGLLTPWWGNAAGLVALTALWAWYRRRPQTRSSGAAHGTALIATITLLIPVAYGLTSTIWWLSLVGFAAVMLGRRQEGKVWGVTIPLVMVASVIAEPYVQIQGVAGELPLELALAKIVFVVILIGMAVGFRRVVEQRALVLHDSEAGSTEALKKSQDLLIQAEKLGKVGGWEFDIETKQQTWTETVYEIHELDITNRPTVDQGINFYTPASRPIIERAVQRAIEQGEPFDLELEIITAKGNLRSVHAIGKADLERRKVSGFFQDITERKQAEQALLQSRRAALNMMTDAVEARDRSEQLSKELKRHREHLEQLVAERTADLNRSEEKFRTLADFTYEWEYWIGPDRSIIYMSPSCERITGYLADEFYKNPGFMDTIIHPKDKAAFKEHINTYHIGGRRGEPCEFEFWIIDKGGREKLIAHVCRPVIGADGLYRGRRVSNRDITDRKHAEEELKRQSVQLEAANKELEAFSYSVSHDLKAPLRSVDGFARMLEEDYAERLDDEGRRLLQGIRDSAQDMGQLINDLLEFSRLSRKDLKTGLIGMSELVEDVRRQIEQAETGRAIRWDLGELPPAFGDEASIRVVLINLLANAVKFTRPRREAAIGISGRVEGNDVVYSVTDNGVGFDMAYRDKLFCVFQRLHATTEFEGTGIGLALVQRIVLRHGGQVWAEGKVNEGATFYFALPCRKNEEEETT